MRVQAAGGAQGGLYVVQGQALVAQGVLVELTAAGLAIITRTIASRDTWMAAHLEGLDDDQLSLLRKAADLLLEVSNG